MAAPVPSAVEMVDGVDFGFNGRSVRVSQEAYSIFLAREQASKDRIAALQQRLTIADQRVDELESERKRLKGMLAASDDLFVSQRRANSVMRSELAGARELLKECVDCVRYGEDFDLPVTTMQRVDDLLARHPSTETQQ